MVDVVIDSNPFNLVVVVTIGVSTIRKQSTKVDRRGLGDCGENKAVIIFLVIVKSDIRVDSTSVGKMVPVICTVDHHRFEAVTEILQLFLEELSQTTSFLYMSLKVVKERLG